MPLLTHYHISTLANDTVHTMCENIFFSNYLLKILHRTFNNLTTAIMCTVLYTENDTFK